MSRGHILDLRWNALLKDFPDSTVFCVRIKTRVAEIKAIPSNSSWCVKFVPKNEAG